MGDEKDQMNSVYLLEKLLKERETWALHPKDRPVTEPSLCLSPVPQVDRVHSLII